jgi:hypothetical protein
MTSCQHNRLIGWTFLILIVTVFLFSYSFLRKSGPLPNEEMQLREAEQRARLLREFRGPGVRIRWLGKTDKIENRGAPAIVGMDVP